jgi:hypothetical protein
MKNFIIGDKKGFLLASETLKIVIAVVCISFLVYFLTSLYFSKIDGEKRFQAENLLEVIQLKLNNLVDDGSDSIDIFNPRGWYFFSFAGYDVKPNSCAGKNCLCICDNAWDLNGRFDRQQKECDKDGACLIEEDLGGFERIEITGELKIIDILKLGGKIYLR